MGDCLITRRGGGGGISLDDERTITLEVSGVRNSDVYISNENLIATTDRGGHIYEAGTYYATAKQCLIIVVGVYKKLTLNGTDYSQSLYGSNTFTVPILNNCTVKYWSGGVIVTM